MSLHSPKVDPAAQRLKIIQSALGGDVVDVSAFYLLLSEQMRVMQQQADRLGRLLEEVHILSGHVSEGVVVLSALEVVVIEALRERGQVHES